MIIFGNLVLLLVIFYFVAIQIEKYNQVILAKYRFSYFALRDRLAMLVIEGKLKEDSWEYDEIVAAINFHIKAVEDISIQKLAVALIRFHNSPEEKRYVKSIQKGPANEALSGIMGDYLDLTYRLLLRNSNMQMKLVRLVAKIGGVISSTNSEAFNIMKDRKKALENVGAYRDSFRETQFA